MQTIKFTKKSMDKSRMDSEGLAIHEVVDMLTNDQLGDTFFQGTTPIDSISTMSNIVMVSRKVFHVDKIWIWGW